MRFSQGYNVQHCPLLMIEKTKEAAVLTDLSKAFDCLKHNLRIAKLHAFAFDYKSLSVMYSYLNNIFQFKKVSLVFLKAQY